MQHIGAVAAQTCYKKSRSPSPHFGVAAAPRRPTEDIGPPQARIQLSVSHVQGIVIRYVIQERLRIYLPPTSAGTELAELVGASSGSGSGSDEERETRNENLEKLEPREV
ncbi:hypothetical protein E4U54_002864 [Claviceps lovelessii]|nr:hypothetical protein E4U54_002864 [Claviceps lovelessii]